MQKCKVKTLMPFTITVLHRLLKNNMSNEYKELIKRIRKENRTNLYKIPHLDFAHSENYLYWMWVDSKGYNAYKKGEFVPYESIYIETAECRNTTTEKQ